MPMKGVLFLLKVKWFRKNVKVNGLFYDLKALQVTKSGGVFYTGMKWTDDDRYFHKQGNTTSPWNLLKGQDAVSEIAP